MDLAGLSERIEQVAANRADPPLHVCVQTIPTVSQPTKGYLLVIVPPTPSKIHMVDGRYWGRGERTRYALAGRHALGDSAARRPGPCEPAEGIGDRLVRGGRQEGS
jgi:hypothetical protein